MGSTEFYYSRIIFTYSRFIRQTDAIKRRKKPAKIVIVIHSQEWEDNACSWNIIKIYLLEFKIINIINPVIMKRLLNGRSKFMASLFHFYCGDGRAGDKVTRSTATAETNIIVITKLIESKSRKKWKKNERTHTRKQQHKASFVASIYSATLELLNKQ